MSAVLSMLSASAPALHSPCVITRASAPYMSATPGVASWYDNGLRLTAEDPVSAVDVTAPVETVETASEASTPEPQAVIRMAGWNPQGLDVSNIPKLLQTQFKAEYLKTAPAYLDGSMPGDIGFDPWALAALAKPTQETDKFARTAEDRAAAFAALTPAEQQKKLIWMRESEIKHARLAMIAVLGWAAAELSYVPGIMDVGTNGRAPSLFNGALFDLPAFPVFFLAAAGAAFFEMKNLDKVEGLTSTDYIPGDYGFDPLGLSSDTPLAGTPVPADVVAKIPNLGDAEALRLAEIKNGRAAMMAITGFAVSEFFWGKPVTELTPIFF